MSSLARSISPQFTTAVNQVGSRPSVAEVGLAHAWQKLENRWLQIDFGLRVALNTIPRDKLIGVRAEQVFAKWHIASERAPRASFVDEFGVEFDRDLVGSPIADGRGMNSPSSGSARGRTSLPGFTSASKAAT